MAKMWKPPQGLSVVNGYTDVVEPHSGMPPAIKKQLGTESCWNSSGPQMLLLSDRCKSPYTVWPVSIKCPERTNLQTEGGLATGQGCEQVVTANGFRGGMLEMFWYWIWDGCTNVNLIKINELYTLKKKIMEGKTTELVQIARAWITKYNVQF